MRSTLLLISIFFFETGFSQGTLSSDRISKRDSSTNDTVSSHMKSYARLEGFTKSNSTVFEVLAKSRDGRFVLYHDREMGEELKGSLLDLKHNKLTLSEIPISALRELTEEDRFINPESCILSDNGTDLFCINNGSVFQYKLQNRSLVKRGLFEGKNNEQRFYFGESKILANPDPNEMYLAIKEENAIGNSDWGIFKTDDNFVSVKETSIELYGETPHILKNGFVIEDSDSVKFYDFEGQLKWHYSNSDLQGLAFCAEEYICFVTANVHRGKKWKPGKYKPQVWTYNTINEQVKQYETTAKVMDADLLDGMVVKGDLVFIYHGHEDRIDLYQNNETVNLLRAKITGNLGIDQSNDSELKTSNYFYVSDEISILDDNFYKDNPSKLQTYKDKILCTLIPKSGNPGMYVIQVQTTDQNLQFTKLASEFSPSIESFSNEIAPGIYQVNSSGYYGFDSQVQVYTDRSELKYHYSISDFMGEFDLTKAIFEISNYPAFRFENNFTQSEEFIQLLNSFDFVDSSLNGWPDDFYHVYRNEFQDLDYPDDVMCYFLAKDKRTFTDNQVHDGIVFYNMELASNTIAPIVYFKFDPKGDYLFYTPDNYYFGTSGALEAHHFVFNNSLYPIEQFDIKYNRPDVILERLGYADSSMVEAYYKAYKKRLKKLNITEEMLKDDFHVPELEILDRDSIPSKTDRGQIPIKVKATDSKYKLNRIHVYVNNVAVFGSEGILVKSLLTNSIEKVLNVPLRAGENFIEVSVLNEIGAESLKDYVTIQCVVEETKPDLYLICIGQGRYRQSEYDLKYAEKDAQDVAQAFENQKYYNNVYTKVLLSEQAVKDSLKDLKSFFDDAGVNDQAIIFIAGHGVLDANLDYFLATYDMDFMNPSEKGISYRFIESLLDGIAPQQKVLMIDACHSGEIDKEEVEMVANEGENTSDIQFRAIGTGVKRKLDVNNTFELTNLLFSDLRKGTGATVMSSAGGMEFAIEGDEWKNGLFTYCVLEGLSSGNADLNDDKEIWFSELRTYVSSQVESLSGGQQKPGARIENQRVDFRVK